LAANWPAIAQDHNSVRVRVYDLANVAPRDLDQALEITRQIFDPSGIHLVFITGDPSDNEAHETEFRASPCQNAPVQPELRLRLVQRAPPGEAAVSYALPCARVGVQVTIFINRVEEMAQQSNVAYHRALGHVAAHEVGHVLLRSLEHDASGMMQPRWSPADWRRMAVGLLAFTKADQTAMIGHLIN
jgi:hypothetical protein